MEDLFARSQVPGVLARRSHIEEAPREARCEEEVQMNPKDNEKKPTKRTFVPDEIWVLPARRRPSEPDDQPDAEDAVKRAASVETFPDRGFVEQPPEVVARVAQVAQIDAPGRGRVVLQTGLGLCASIVLAACGARDNRPQHVGPPLGDTHISQGPSDPTVPPPDAGDYETPSPAYEITPPQGPPPNQPSPSSQEPAPQPAPQPGVFSPPPPPSGPPDVSQPEIPKP